MSVISQAILNRYQRKKDIDRGLVLDLPLRCGYTAKKGTLAPTVARNSTATYINPGDGLLKTAAVNEPRFEADGLLMEPQSQNVLEQSEDWNAGTNWSINRNVIIAPNGLQTADTITFTASPASATKSFTVTVNPGDKYTFSVWLKGTPGETVRIGITRLAGTYEFSETEVTLTASWQRYSVTHTFAYSQTGVIPYCAKSGTVTFDIWGAQLEVGSVATSYIPTISSAVTRYADTLSYAMSDSLKAILADQGTLIVQFMPGFAYTALSAAESILSTSDANTGLVYCDNNGKILTGDGTNTAERDIDFAASTVYGIAIRWQKLTNSMIVSTKSGATWTHGTPGTFDGAYPLDTNMNLAYGLTKPRRMRLIRVFNRALTNSEIARY